MNASLERECGEKLDEVATAIAACQQCPLYEQRTLTVPGYGNPMADIVFIGEGPGKSEDEQGVPFVGRAGKLLSELLESISLTREDVYITNVVKCRPPENRDPEPEEARLCFGFLKKQLEIIQPKVIVNLGRHSMDRFLPGLKISEAHGTAKRRTIEGLGTYVFYPIYHPAAALYNPNLKSVLLEDIQKIPKLLKKLEQ